MIPSIEHVNTICKPQLLRCSFLPIDPTDLPGPKARSVTRLIADSGVGSPILARALTFLEIDHEICIQQFSFR